MKHTCSELILTPDELWNSDTVEQLECRCTWPFKYQIGGFLITITSAEPAERHREEPTLALDPRGQRDLTLEYDSSLIHM